MVRSRLGRRWLAVALTLSMLFSLLPQLQVGHAQAAGGDLEVKFGAGTTIGNLSYDATNAFINFYNNQPGFVRTETDSDEIIDWAEGTILPDGDNGVGVEFEIRVKDNPALLALAKSGHAEAFVGWEKLDYDEFGCVLGICKTRVTSAAIFIDQHELAGSSHGGDTFYRSMTEQIHENSVIRISVGIEGRGAGAYGIFIKFQDKTRPVLKDYTFKGNGAERQNKVGQQELFAKQDEYVSLSYNFSEPVKPTALNQAYYEHFLRHRLFDNPDGTGLPAEGQTQYLRNMNYTAGDFGKSYFEVPLTDSIEYKYTASKYHHSGNTPVAPKIVKPESGSSQGSPMDFTLEEKMVGAVLADAAGNVAMIDSDKFITASAASNSYLHNKVIDPFAEKNKAGDTFGYRVIIDAGSY